RALSTTENSLTGHIVLRGLDRMEETRKRLKQSLREMNIAHATLECEQEHTDCGDRSCVL
ncbi:MAG: cation transporter, partial [Planctomycetia bacterium]|nr:cation transporter [Planctomycetia bacterium]